MKTSAKYSFVLILCAILFAGCSSIEKTTSTKTAAVVVPAESVQDESVVPLKIKFSNFVADSIGRWYLETYCKGSAKVEKSGLSSSVAFKVKKDTAVSSGLSIQTNLYAVSQEKKIPASVETSTEEKTPSAWWIFWNGLLYTIISFVVGFALGGILTYKNIRS